MAKCVSVDLGQIIEGRTLNFPIHDPRGVLLLAAGTVFTGEHRQQLADRNVVNVLMDEADVATATRSQNREPDERELAQLEVKLNERLDALIRSGMLTVINNGPALLNNVTRHVTKGYDRRLKDQLLGNHAEGADQVDKLMKTAVAGTEMDGRQIGNVATVCMQGMLADIDSALGVCSQKNNDPSLSEHALNVALMGIAIGIDMGFDAKNVRTIGISGLLQDLGMVRVPERIRNARRRLTASERLDIQRHAIHTANILELVNGLPALVQMVAYQVHERPDGSGYPRGRDKKCIHLFARILHVADSYLAMTSQRPFRPPLMPYAAMECLLRQAKKNQVDASVVSSLLRILSLFPIGSHVRLSDGRVAQVIRANPHCFARPIVAIVDDASSNSDDVHDEVAGLDLCGSELSVIQALPTPGSEQIPLSAEIANWSVRAAWKPAEINEQVPQAESEPRNEALAATP